MLLTVKVPIAGLEEELRLVRQELARRGMLPYIPELFLKLGIEALRVLRSDDALGLNPAAVLDAAVRCRQCAAREDRPVTTLRDMCAAVQQLVQPCAADADCRVREAFPDVQKYLRSGLPGIDIEAVGEQFYAYAGNGPPTGASVRQWIASGAVPEALCALSAWIAQHETLHRYLMHEVTAAYIAAYRENPAPEHAV